MGTATETTYTKILPLTSVRFFAAAYVMMGHLAGNSDLLGHGDTLVLRLLHLNFTSVPFFFVLSGFVLALAYLNNRKTIPVRRFFLARFARLYPLIVAAMLLDLPHSLFVQREMVVSSPGGFVAMLANSFLVLSGWFPSIGTLDPPVWSVSVEVFFYLLFPLVGPLIWKMGSRSALMFALVAYAMGNFAALHMASSETSSVFLSYDPLLHLYEFLIGVGTARLFLVVSKNDIWASRLARFAPALALICALAYLSIPIFAIPVSRSLMQHGVLVPIFVLLIFAFSSGNKNLSKVFSHPWLVVLGEASFALYLIHYPIGLIMRKFMTRHHVLGTSLYIAIVIAMSVSSFYWFETPLRRWILSLGRVKDREDETTLALAQ